MCLHSMTSMLYQRGTQADNVNNPVQPEQPLGAVGGDKKQLCVGTEQPCLAADMLMHAALRIWEGLQQLRRQADRQHFPFFFM